MPQSPVSNPTDDAHALKRELGLLECTLMGVGVILGAGIYALVGKTAGLAGDAVWISFLLAAAVASLTGLSYAELAALIPRAGGEYHYALRAFGRRAAFMVTWLLLVGLGIASAAVALGFGGYLQVLTGTPPVPGALLLIAACAGLLLYGVKASARVAVLCTGLELTGLLAVLWVGLPHLGEVDLLTMPRGWEGIGAAAALIFFAFIGFEEIVQLAEEVREPERNMPRALLLSIAITTALYVGVALAAISVLGWERLGASDSPLAEVLAATGGSEAGAAMSVIALFSTGNTVLILLLSASRLLYGMAEDGSLPAGLARVSTEQRTPWVATLLVAGVAALIAAAFERIEVVASLTNFAIFVTFILINAAVIALRLREPDAPRPFRVPLSLGPVPLIPLAGALSAAVMLLGVGWTAAAWGSGAAALGLGVMLALPPKPGDPV